MSIKSHLADMDDLLIVKEPIDPDLGITPYLKEHLQRPVLFEDVRGARLVGNLWASRERIAAALGTDREGLTHLIAGALGAPKPARRVDVAPVLENSVDDVDLTRLPIPRFYTGDGGPYITAGVVVAEQEGTRNASFHRFMVTGPRTAVARLVPRHLYAMHRRALEDGADLPIAVAIGTCPPVLISAACSVPYGQDELEIASAMRLTASGEPVEVVSLPGSGLLVPANAEMVLEGRVTTNTAPEGPFVDITGTVDLVREQPVVEFDRMYRKSDPIFHAILPGGYEHYMLMGLPKEPLIHRAVSGVVPAVRGVRLTEGGCCWLHAVVSIRQQKAGDARNAILAAFAGHASLKQVIVVDEDVDPFDDRAVEWAVATRFQGDRDLVVVEGARGSSLDPSADSTTAKLGIDATMPVDGDPARFKLVV